MNNLKKKNEYFMGFALEEAKKALRIGEFPVGCVLVSQGKVLASGARQNSIAHGNEIDHAEITALRSLGNLNGCTLGPISAYCTLEPCLMCYAALILAGVRHIVWAYEDVMGGGTRCDLSSLPPLYSGCKVEITTGVLRQESLTLFKTFFSARECQYWNESLLAEYTLKQ